MSKHIPAFGAGNHNVAIAAGTVAFDPPTRSAASGVWTAFELESVDGIQPPIVVKCWKELARYVIDHVKAGCQITAKGELEVTPNGLAIKASFLELVPAGIRLPKPTRVLLTLSGVISADGRATSDGRPAAAARLKVMTGKLAAFELDLEGIWGQGGERLALVRSGDYCLAQGSLKQRGMGNADWKPILETVEVLAAYPYDTPDYTQPPVIQLSAAVEAPPAPMESPKEPPELALAQVKSVPTESTAFQKRTFGAEVVNPENL